MAGSGHVLFAPPEAVAAPSRGLQSSHQRAQGPARAHQENRVSLSHTPSARPLRPPLRARLVVARPRPLVAPRRAAVHHAPRARVTPVALVLRGRAGELSWSHLAGRLRIEVAACDSIDHAFVATADLVSAGVTELQAVLYVRQVDGARAVDVVTELCRPLADAGATLVAVVPAPWGHGSTWPPPGLVGVV